MAVVTIPDESRSLREPAAVREFLAPFGLWYERWDVDGRIDRDASAEEILAEYAPEIETLKERGGFVTADVINVNPETPNLEAMLARFRREHTHDEDEVRFTVKGQGVFHIHPENGPVFAIHVESGDLINVPRGTKHWFDLCEDRTIRCIRLFQDVSGWTPHYVEGSDLHSLYPPICMGPQMVLAEGASPNAVRLP